MRKQIYVGKPMQSKSRVQCTAGHLLGVIFGEIESFWRWKRNSEIVTSFKNFFSGILPLV
jgi:hypothetical protein